MLIAQSCPTLCYPKGCSPPGSSVHGILQARIPGWVAIPLSLDLPDPGIEPWSPALQADSLPSELPGKPGTVQISGHFLHLIYLIHLLHVNSYHCQHFPFRLEDWSLAQFQKVHWVSVSAR